MLKNGTLSSRAIARARWDFPVPEGPVIRVLARGRMAWLRRLMAKLALAISRSRSKAERW